MSVLQASARIGDWIVERPLGEGGMGTVYRCHNVFSDRIVAAVKVLRPHVGDEGRERFAREVEALARLRHPNIVSLIGFGQDSRLGLLFLATEVVEGEDFGARLRKGPVDSAVAARVMRGVGEGLTFAHRSGFFHRDLKPANIVVRSDGTGCLLDFGIALDADRSRLTREGLIPGTLAYLPPEAFLGEELDFARGDIYSFGLVFYEALTGGAAFPEEFGLSEKQRMVRLMAQKTRPRTFDVGADASPAVREEILKATAFDPGRRPHSLEALLAALATMGPVTPQLSAPKSPSEDVRSRVALLSRGEPVGSSPLDSPAETGRAVPAVPPQDTLWHVDQARGRAPEPTPPNLRLAPSESQVSPGAPPAVAATHRAAAPPPT